MSFAADLDVVASAMRQSSTQSRHRVGHKQASSLPSCGVGAQLDR